MVEIKLDADTMRTFSLFERLTGTALKDLVEEEDRTIFLVAGNKLGKALGKKAGNLRKLREHLDKEVVLVGFADEREAFLRNIFHRTTIDEVEWEDRNGDLIVHVTVPSDQKGRAIGKGGRNIQLARTLMKRHFDVRDIQLDSPVATAGGSADDLPTEAPAPAPSQPAPATSAPEPATSQPAPTPSQPAPAPATSKPAPASSPEAAPADSPSTADEPPASSAPPNVTPATKGDAPDADDAPDAPDAPDADEADEADDDAKPRDD